MSNSNLPVDEISIYRPEALQRLLSVLWNSREEPPTRSVMLYVVLGAYAGLRPAETLALEWKQVDWLQREIRLAPPAVKAARIVPIKDNLMTFLTPYKGFNGPVIIHKKVANLLRNACQDADVVHISNGLRRSYAVYRIAETSDEVAQLELGLEPSQLPERKALPEGDVAAYWAVCP